MPALSEKPLAHVHWRIYKEDNERLKAMFGHDHGGMNRAIRAMVHSFLNLNYAALRTKIDELEGNMHHDLSNNHPPPTSLRDEAPAD